MCLFLSSVLVSAPTTAEYLFIESAGSLRRVNFYIDMDEAHMQHVV